MPNNRTSAPSEKIVVHEHDVLNGRGVNIAQHPGNLRFRALVKSHADQSYCSDYSTSAKKALAEEIISHIRNLNPPGRFLKRPARVKKADVDDGPWEELTDRETLKKTCQALRDCNRGDRAEYARHIEAPVDVQASKEHRQLCGLSNREYAERIASCSVNQTVIQASEGIPSPAAVPSGSNGSLWVDTSAALDNQGPQEVRSYATTTPKPTTTPATAASSGGFHSFPEEPHHAGSVVGDGDDHSVSGVQLPFGDHFTNSPTQAAALDYEPFTLDEEQKISAMDRDSNNFADAFEDGCQDAHEALLGRPPLDEHTDFTTVFDGDLTI